VVLLKVFITVATMSSRSSMRAILPSVFVSGTSAWPIKSHGPAEMNPVAVIPSSVSGQSTSPAICSRMKRE
jgi:hypothetical protein